MSWVPTSIYTSSGQSKSPEMALFEPTKEFPACPLCLWLFSKEVLPRHIKECQELRAEREKETEKRRKAGLPVDEDLDFFMRN